jgi:hypothetical protein
LRVGPNQYGNSCSNKRFNTPEFYTEGQMANYDPTDLRGQERVQQEDADRKRLLRETEIADVKWLMSSERGRRIIWRLLRTAGVFQLSFDQNAMKMAFNEGQRNFGNQILDNVMKVCPEQFPAMLKEQQDGSRRDGSGDPKPK